MKRLLLFIAMISAFCCNAQNYQCLQSGVKQYFTNNNGYLRGIRIDSVRAVGSDSVFYPFHTFRFKPNVMYGGYTPAIPDTVEGSWLGNKVIMQPNGTFLFDNMGSDTVIIKTQAHLSDTWIFYNDTTNIYYTATITAIDTMTVLGTLDTVKTIKLNAYSSGVLNSADPINNFEIKLSKHQGFVQVFDLYTFPYHFGLNTDYFFLKSNHTSAYIFYEDTSALYVTKFLKL